MPWDLVTLVEGQGGTADLDWELIDGNPPYSGRVQTVVNARVGELGVSRVYAFFFREESTYSPRASSAAILSLAYSEDLRFLGAGAGEVESTAAALRQNGRLYAAGGLAGFVPSSWTTSA